MDPVLTAEQARWSRKLETIGVGLLFVFVAAMQLSVATAGILLALVFASWVGLLVFGHKRGSGLDAVETVVPHLHNNPLQIAAERGVPGLAVWIWFVVAAVTGLIGRMRHPETRTLAAAGLAALASMLAAGMFEYSFGDSEFLMLLLVLVTLPHAAARSSPSLPTRLRHSR